MKPSYFIFISYGSMHGLVRGPFTTIDPITLRLIIAKEDLNIDDAKDTAYLLDVKDNEIGDAITLDISRMDSVVDDIRLIDDAGKDELPLFLNEIKTPEGKLYLSQKLKGKYEF